MPELPEVETVVRDLLAHDITGERIAKVDVCWPRSVAELSAEAFNLRVCGAAVADIRRRGKYIVIILADRGAILVHLRMTGQLRFGEPPGVAADHDRLVLHFESGRALHFRDTRKFGRWRWVADPEKALAHLGPEPFTRGLSADRFAAMLSRHRRMIKPLLLDQGFIAGIGNIYADEALFDAGIHPQRLSSGLSQAEAARLLRGIRRVLQRGIDAMGTTLGTGRLNFYSVSGRRGRNADALKVFRRTGEPCPVCGDPVQWIIVGQRSTHFCACCQRER